MTFHHNIFLTCSLSCMVAASGRPSDTLAIIVNKTILSGFYRRFSCEKSSQSQLCYVASRPPQATSAKLLTVVSADVAGFSSADPHVTRDVPRQSIGRSIPRANFPSDAKIFLGRFSRFTSIVLPRLGTRRKKKENTLACYVVFSNLETDSECTFERCIRVQSWRETRRPVVILRTSRRVFRIRRRSDYQRVSRLPDHCVPIDR